MQHELGIAAGVDDEVLEDGAGTSQQRMPFLFLRTQSPLSSLLYAFFIIPPGLLTVPQQFFDYIAASIGAAKHNAIELQPKSFLQADYVVSG